MTYPALHDALRNLTPTGLNGFEGLLRAVLAEVTGQRFALMKSGPQGGVDVLGDVGGTGLMVGLEAKHYGSSTHLSLDALEAKLQQAARTYPAMELWVLATTRPVGAGDQQSLAGLGSRSGVDVLILEWTEDPTGPPPLAVLCAQAPHAVEALLGREVSLLRDLDAIRAHSRYPVEVARLRDRLTSSLVGYGATRPKVDGWIAAQLTDTKRARLAFDSYANLLQSDVSHVERRNVEAALDTWWENPARPLCALGEEGVGKTWAILAWWRRRSAEAKVPLTLVIPARDVSGTDGPELLARALQKATGVRDDAFWLARLRCWIAAPTIVPRLLVIFDGLNQNWSFTDWTSLLLSLAAGPWEGRVAVALTCRPDHWRRRLHSLETLPGGVEHLEVLRFDDGELNALLADHGLARHQFEGGLLELLRVPRLCQLAIRRRKQLGSGGGDITREQLVYEDWRDRNPVAQEALGDEGFRRFIAGLGRTLRDELAAGPLTRAEILARIEAGSGRDSGEFEGVLSELIDGRWLRAADDPHRFTVDPDKLPHALGLALLERLRGVSAQEEAKDRIGELLEPLGGLDLGAAILRHATTFALVEPKTGEAVRMALLVEWLSSQNTSGADFEAFWRLIGLSPALFLDLAEALWFGDTPNPRGDEFLHKGFANAWRWPEVARALEERLTLWFSRYWLDPLEGEILGHVPDDEAAEARRAATRLRAMEWAAEAPALTLDFSVRESQPHRQAWGSYRAIELLSWLPRAPLVRSITAWAVTASILGAFRQEAKMAWVLRWNPEDPREAEDALIVAAKKLMAGGQIAHAAAARLLAGLATRRAAALAVSLPPNQAIGVDTPFWDFDTALRSSRVTREPLAAILWLPDDPLDPGVTLNAVHEATLAELSARLRPEQLAAKPGEEDGGFSLARRQLARWRPVDLARILRAKVRAHSPAGGLIARLWDRICQRGGAAQGASAPRWLLDLLPSLIPLLEASDLRPYLAEATRQRRAGDWDDGLQACALAGQDASSQIRLLDARPHNIPWPSWLTSVLSAPDATAWLLLQERLAPSRPTPELLAWLSYVKCLDITAPPPGWVGLSRLFAHPEAAVRAAALERAWEAQDEALGRDLAETGWSCHAGMASDEALFGSLLLTLAPMGDDNRAARLLPVTLGELVHRNPDNEEALGAFAAFVATELGELRTAASRAYPLYQISQIRGLDVLVRTRPETLGNWLQPFLEEDEGAATRFLFFGERFPLLSSLEAFEAHNPGVRARMLARMLGPASQRGMRLGSLYDEALSLKAGADTDATWRLVLEEANTDEKLWDFALGLQRAGALPALLDFIREDLRADTAGLIARGLTLAGFLERTNEADALWCQELATPPAVGWLTDVHTEAQRCYARDRWSEHWENVFWAAGDEVHAYAAQELFLTVSDPRIQLSRFPPDLARQRPPRRRMLWWLRAAELVPAFEAHRDKLKQSFLNSNPPLSGQRPASR